MTKRFFAQGFFTMPYLLVWVPYAETTTQLKKAAEVLGYGVGIAHDLKSVLLSFQQRPIAALIVDVVLYETALAEIEKEKPKCPFPIIGVSRNKVSSSSLNTKSFGLRGEIPFESSREEMTFLLRKYLDSPEGVGWESEGFIGRSEPMQELYSNIKRIAVTTIPVLIVGETGTGKELVAQAIHKHSSRGKDRFLPLNCGAIASQLVESELFGHEKGSFTGADKTRKGYFELASAGSLFLDEITEMPPDMQVKLLRLLETGQYMRVGGDKELKTEARIIAATNRNPLDAVAAEKLREDLYYRLTVFPIWVPPLRKRKEDIMALALHFLQEMNRQQQTEKYLCAGSQQALLEYHWPGNVRELRNVVWRSFILADRDEVQVSLS